MKTRFLMLFLSALLMAACSNDDNAPVTDQLTFEGENYPINLVQYDGLTSSQTNFNLLFYPNGTHAITLVFPGIDEIPDGNYTYRQIDDPDFNPDSNFSGGTLYITPNVEPNPITSGSVRFSTVGQEHKITFDVETTAGRVKGSYQGPLVQI